jgi:hypothetical protein
VPPLDFRQVGPDPIGVHRGLGLVAADLHLDGVEIGEGRSLPDEVSRRDEQPPHHPGKRSLDETCSIFMASRTRSSSPARRISPGRATTDTTVP